MTCHSNLGYIYHKKGELDKAILHYKQLIDIEPEYTDAYINIGLIFEIKKDFPVALESFLKAYELEPELDIVYS